MSSISYRIIQAVAILTVSASLSSAHVPDDEGDSKTPATNLQVIQRHFGDLAEQIFKEAELPPEAAIGLKIRQSPESWITEHPISERMAALGHEVIYIRDSDSAAQFIFNLGDVGARVKYSNTRRAGMFGRKCTERTVSVHMQAQIYESQTGRILSGKTLTSEHRDTVFTDDISQIENPELPMTRAELPAEPFIDRFIEPIIIIGTAGVAVFLFFHIRS